MRDSNRGFFVLSVLLWLIAGVPGTPVPGAGGVTPALARGEEIAQRLECGTAWVNQHMSMSAKVPFGGVKWSGLGRENGKWGIEEFCELQVVNAARA